MMVATIATSIAGCSSLASGDGVGDSGATDVVVSNLAATPQTVSITITKMSAERPHTSRTLELSPGEVVDPVNSSRLPTNKDTTYTVEVTVENGPSETFEWAEPTVELAPLWIQIDDTRNIKFLLQAG